MISLKTNLTRFLVVIALALPMTAANAANAANAAEEFHKSGLITKVNASTVNIYLYDIDFRIRSFTKIEIPNVKDPDMSDFKKGDNVYLQGKISGGVYYVDRILFIPQQPG